MPLDAEDFFKLHADKSRDVINNRNFFETVYITSLLAIFVPLVANPAVFQFLKDNPNYSTAIILLVVTSTVLVFHFWELKFREYRKNYMKIALKELCHTRIFTKVPLPRDFGELCDILHEHTYFSKKHIMEIISELDIEENLLPPGFSKVQSKKPETGVPPLNP